MLLSVFFGDSAVPRSVIDHSSDTVSGDKLILETDSDDMSMPSDDEIVCEAHKNSTKSCVVKKNRRQQLMIPAD